MLQKDVNYKVKDYSNRWSIVDEFRGFVLLENNTYGDETCYLVCRKSLKAFDHEYTKRDGSKFIAPTIEGRVYETFDDIETCLQDEGII